MGCLNLWFLGQKGKYTWGSDLFGWLGVHIMSELVFMLGWGQVGVIWDLSRAGHIDCWVPPGVILHTMAGIWQISSFFNFLGWSSCVRVRRHQPLGIYVSQGSGRVVVFPKVIWDRATQLVILMAFFPYLSIRTRSDLLLRCCSWLWGLWEGSS